MKGRTKAAIRNFKTDYSASKNYREIIRKQYERYGNRLLNATRKIVAFAFYPCYRSIRGFFLSQQTWEHLPPKKIIETLLGDTGYQHFKKLIASAPNKKEAIFQTGMFLIHAGLPDEGIKCLATCLSLSPDDRTLHYYLAFLMFTSPDQTSMQMLYDEHVKWGKTLISGKQYDTYPNSLTLNRRLKIGYTCHFVTNSTSTTLLLPMLAAHNKDNVEIFMYSDQDPGQTNDETRQLVENWRDTYGLTHDEFCEQIRRDQIDILLELNGHCPYNRYRALTRKPAPVQISYYNYSCTTGIPGIDYTLAAKGNADFSDLQPYYSEKIFVMEGVAASTALSSHFPPVSPSPFLQKGYITFGSFGQAHKVTRQMIQVWCEILKRVPNSRFYMKATVLDHPANLSVFKKHFAESGIDLSRIYFEGPSDYATLLKLYGEMDIALDTYPHANGTTTIEAFIQGVPTISLVGQRYCSRHGFSNLHSVGHDELLAYSKEEYIEKAVQLAKDTARLTHYRQTFRDDYKHSSRADMKTFISELENTYKSMWATYIDEKISSFNQTGTHA